MIRRETEEVVTPSRTYPEWIEPADIGREFQDSVSIQSYAPRQEIDGVVLQELRLLADESGDFSEVARLDEHGHLESFPEYRPAQISYSLLLSGGVKAWHLHLRQDDLWFVPPEGRLLVGLLDLREASRTYRMTMRIILGTAKPSLLLIPRGVAHGVANPTQASVSWIYFANCQFNLKDPDERRLPLDLLGKDFWKLRPE